MKTIFTALLSGILALMAMLGVSGSQAPEVTEIPYTETAAETVEEIRTVYIPTEATEYEDAMNFIINGGWLEISDKVSDGTATAAERAAFEDYNTISEFWFNDGYEQGNCDGYSDGYEAGFLDKKENW